MTGPGKGRHTNYVGYHYSGLSSMQGRFHKLFNTNQMVPSAPGEISSLSTSSDRGLFYGASIKSSQTDNVTAAVNSKGVYIGAIIDGFETKDLAKLDDGNLIYYVGNSLNDLPDTSNLSDEIKNSEGSPENNYVPCLSSPGTISSASEDPETGILLTSISKNPQINVDPQKIVAHLSPDKIKSNLIIPKDADDKQSIGTLSPSNSSKSVGILSIGANLTMGSSKK